MAYAIPTPAGQRIPEGENLLKFVLLASLIQLNFLGVDVLVTGAGAQWPLAAKLAIAVPAAVLNGFFIIGLGVLGHDANHRVLFRNQVLNELIGGLSAVGVLVPFNANRQFHLTHHAYAHQPGLDPENRMHHRPFWLAVTFGPQLGLFLQYRIFLVNLFTRVTDPRYVWRSVADACFLAAGAGYYVALPLALGVSLAWTVVPTLLAFPVVFAWRAMSDHYGVPAVARKSQRGEDVIDVGGADDPRERVRVTGWVVMTHPLLQWLWSSVNYHEVHHKYPWLAHCHLQAVFEHTRGEVPYMVARGYTRNLLNLRDRPYYEQPARVQGFLTCGLADEQKKAS
ncbi:MAG: fatty acid desaturase family protein [Gammaproteobacteria bacterium]